MKRIRTARELYSELLKSFYFGTYRTGDRLMTYQETHEVYGLAKDTIGAAYAMLRQDGFIRTDRKNGTIVIFDANNPAHVAKVPLDWPCPRGTDTAPHAIAMRLHGNTLRMGLIRANETQLLECRKLVEGLIQQIRDGSPYYIQVFRLWMQIVSALDNELLSRIMDHFLSRYLYLVPQQYLSAEQCVALRDGAQRFYEYLLDAIDHRAFDAFLEQFERHCDNYYRAGGLVFAKLEEGTVFKEQALYERLLDDLCARIAAGALCKGDALPTTAKLCKEYGVSRTTVNRAYGILAEMGLIDRRARNGTRLIAAPNDPEIRESLEETAGLRRRDWKDAVAAISVIIDTLNRWTIVPQAAVEQMEAELARQHRQFDRYDTPFFTAAVLIGPVVAQLPVGILHKYYIYLTDIMSRMMSLYTFRVKGSHHHGEEVYQGMRDALDALVRGDQTTFAQLSRKAMQRNVELLELDFLTEQTP